MTDVPERAGAARSPFASHEQPLSSLSMQACHRMAPVSAIASLVVVFLVAAVPASGGARFAIAPQRLMATNSWFPDLGQPESGLRATRSPSGWAFGILEDPPANGRREVARLKREGFVEGVHRTIAGGKGQAFSGALVVRTAVAATRESQIKAGEEQRELGAGVVRFALSTIPGGIGLTQSHPAAALTPGELQTSVVFAVGRCTLGVGLRLAPPSSQGAVQHAAIAAAVRLLNAVRHACR
jgi:hypothetical protein